MPELPEVETVARDLRPRITGATIVDADDAVGADAARHHARGVRRRRRGPADRGRLAARQAGRRVARRRRVPDDPPQDDRPAVRRAARAGRTIPYVRLVLELEDGREIRFRDIRKFGRVGLYGAADDDPFAATGPEPLSDCVHGRLRSGAGSAAARAASSRCSSTSRSSPASATSTRTRRSGRPASIRSGPRGRCGPPTSGASGSSSAGSSPRRSSGAARRSTTTPRPTATARCRSTSRVYQRAGEPCLRCGRPIRRIVVGGRATHFCSWCQRLPAADRAGARAILRTMATPDGAAGAGPSCRAGRGASG